ncbi:hypothetical protein GURKE_04820 [Brevundimonas phage vB_BpoS-Gurke]|uniref:Uncharacterized protein n=1 Tax=Brevundimonas phage vB_BpoS-Gurke TaxID=2948599 RepID=A0A9E7N522_9CAUD|nr:hypothetical protein GURKE_04820 [Brevundimonas phage vB_BpoS-Gurke]
MFAVVPSLAPHRGDPRRDAAPYFIASGVSYADLNTANSAMRHLNRIGHACHLEVLAADGRPA